MARKPSCRPEILAQWARAPVPAESPADRAARRARIVRGAVRTMQTRRARPLVARRWSAQVAVAAALLLLVVGGWCLPEIRAALVGRSHRALRAAHPGAPARALEADAPAKSASPAAAPFPSAAAQVAPSLRRWQTPAGIEVTADADALLSLPRESLATVAREELVLASGLVWVRVPKLPSGHTFALRTPDALIIVHGTSFSVDVSPSVVSGNPRTHVVVNDGIVAVEHARNEVLLTAGMEWSSAQMAAKQSDERATSSRAAASGTTAAHDAAANDTELAEQNALFAQAMNARERGNPAVAVQVLDDFLRRYPTAPLAQDAQVQTFRAFVQMGDRASAERAARRYLASYGAGFAADEARALALGK